MPLILLLHLILDASVSIIRAYSDILRGHPCLIDLVVKDKVKVLGIWFGKDHKNTNWLQIQNKVKIQWKDRRLSLRHKVLIINTYILSQILYVARIVPPEISVLIIEQSSAC
jgi:nicotinamide riboside kinase